VAQPQGYSTLRRYDVWGESAPSGVVGSPEHLNPHSYINPPVSALQIHDFPPIALSEINLLFEENLAQYSQLPLFGAQITHHSPPSSSNENTANNNSPAITYEGHQVETASSQASSCERSPEIQVPQPSSPANSIQLPEDSLDGKMKVDRHASTFSCTTCKEVFTNHLRYRQHIGRRVCTAQCFCHGCGTTFKHPKDLRRHQGSEASVTSCSKLKASSLARRHFACICGIKPYTRKDSLQRHLKKLAGQNEKHRCKLCHRNPCCC